MLSRNSRPPDGLSDAVPGACVQHVWYLYGLLSAGACLLVAMQFHIKLVDIHMDDLSPDFATDFQRQLRPW